MFYNFYTITVLTQTHLKCILAIEDTKRMLQSQMSFPFGTQLTSTASKLLYERLAGLAGWFSPGAVSFLPEYSLKNIVEAVSVLLLADPTFCTILTGSPIDKADLRTLTRPCDAARPEFRSTRGKLGTATNATSSCCSTCKKPQDFSGAKNPSAFQRNSRFAFGSGKFQNCGRIKNIREFRFPMFFFAEAYS